MIRSEQELFVRETEIKPNRYATLAMAFCVGVVVVCWVLDEIGIFRVGKTEMRIGMAITFIVSLFPLLTLLLNKSMYSNPRTKYYVIIASSIFTFTVGTLLTFHTTILMLFPILIAMLYRSKQIGIIATVSSFTCTLLCPILSYVLGTWDIELFKELILIGTNGTAVIEGAFPGITLLNIEKIILYLVFPRLLMIGSCALLLFNNIKLGVNHVENQIQLFRIGNRDALTGLFNRNCYQELLENSKTEDPVGVIFFDVNGLKAANDSNGHEYGDLLLQRSAKSLLDVCDENSYGFRLGGDEFAIICFGANEETTCEKIVAWQASLTKINLENESKYDGLICSLAYGYACGPISQLEELTRLSDHRMYQRKLSMKTAR